MHNWLGTRPVWAKWMSQGWNICRLHRLLCMSLALSRPYNHVSVAAFPVTNIVSLITFFLCQLSQRNHLFVVRRNGRLFCVFCVAAIDLKYLCIFSQEPERSRAPDSHGRWAARAPSRESGEWFWWPGDIQRSGSGGISYKNELNMSRHAPWPGLKTRVRNLLCL